MFYHSKKSSIRIVKTRIQRLKRRNLAKKVTRITSRGGGLNSMGHFGFHFEFIPLGASRRSCPGTLFAITIEELVLTNFLFKFDIALPYEKGGEDLDMTETTGRSGCPTAKKHGPIILLHFGSVPVLVITSPDAAREIMKIRDLIFSNRPQATIPSKLLYDSKDMAFSPYCEYWRQVKSIGVLNLLSNKRVESYKSTREAETAIMIEKINKNRLGGFGEEVGRGRREELAQVIINAWAIGRDPLVWEDPEEFKPERFLNSSIDFKGFHFKLIPFGAGRRGCPGALFVMAVIELALANLLYTFDIALQDGQRAEDLDMTETSGITVHKKSPILVATPYSS
ncbi:hypothetical protein LguiB_007718 [Lonicera macranthoides]